MNSSYSSTIGPRKILYKDKDGLEGEISVWIDFGESKVHHISEDFDIPQRIAKVRIESSWFTREMTLEAEDDIQAIFRVMRVSDIYIQKICKDNSFIVFKNYPDDVEKELDLYS